MPPLLPIPAGLSRRGNGTQGTVPLAPREGDRSMFSADIFPAKHDFPPKNGPVPPRATRLYGQGSKWYLMGYGQRVSSNRLGRPPAAGLGGHSPAGDRRRPWRRRRLDQPGPGGRRRRGLGDRRGAAGGCRGGAPGRAHDPLGDRPAPPLASTNRRRAVGRGSRLYRCRRRSRPRIC